MTTCSHCRNPTTRYGRFCPHCGAKIDKAAAAPPLPAASPQIGFDPATTVQERKSLLPSESLSVTVRHLPYVNRSLLHAGLPFISSLTIANRSDLPLGQVTVETALEGFTQTALLQLGTVPPRTSIRRGPVPLAITAFPSSRRGSMAWLRLRVLSEGEAIWQTAVSVGIHPPWQWVCHPSLASVSSCFALPWESAVTETVSLAVTRLVGDAMSRSEAFAALPAAQLAKALYLTFRDDLSLAYVAPPASHESPLFYEDGSFSFSQRVRPPHEVMRHRQGTCLDYTFFLAACLERMGLAPVIGLLEGHSILGYWSKAEARRPLVETRHRHVLAAAEAGELIAMNSTTFTASQVAPYAECLRQGLDLLRDASQFQSLIDVAACRAAGLRPLDPKP